MKIQIVRLDLNIPYEKYSGMEDHLPKERAERIRRFRFDADKIRSLAAGLLLEKALDAYRADEVMKERYVLKTGEHGKPYLDGADDFHFSISHAGEYVVLAADDAPVGVDIEAVRLREKVARRFYSKREQEALFSTPEEKRPVLFTKIWTGKEAYLKYTGSGLIDPIASVEVLDPGYRREKQVFFSGAPVGDGAYYLTVCAGKKVCVSEVLEETTLERFI